MNTPPNTVTNVHNNTTHVNSFGYFIPNVKIKAQNNTINNVNPNATKFFLITTRRVFPQLI